MTYKIDNRWSPGASGITDEIWTAGTAAAAYSARWIDRGDSTPADVLPDRQGFAYNDGADRDRLIARLKANKANTLHQGLGYDVTLLTWSSDDDDFAIALRRAGGYVYVDAYVAEPATL